MTSHERSIPVEGGYNRASTWQRALRGVREDVATAMKVGAGFATVAGLIGIAGILQYCPRCGRWEGAGPPPDISPTDQYRYARPPEVDEAGAQRLIDRGWVKEGAVDAYAAITRQDGARVEAIWADVDGLPPDVQTHGHIVTDDGLNAIYVREPGGHVILDDRRQDPYEHYTDERRTYRPEGGVYDCP